jgi:MFS transporter, OFA family, oxalate/formate antiporter
MVATATVARDRRNINRWIQLIAAIIAMLAISNLQYAWTLFTAPLRTSLHASLPAIQVAFSAFILTETWLVPFEGAITDWLGPRLMQIIGGILVGIGWVGTGYATSVTQVIIAYAIGGIGAGAVYAGAVGNALKWFPDHRGLCVGLTAGAYGIGTALTVLPIARMIRTSGYGHTLVFWGIIQGVIVILMGLLLHKPPAGWSPPNWKEEEKHLKVQMSNVDMTPWQMMHTGSFYVIYFMMALVGW